MRERVAKPKKASTSSFSIPKLRQPTRGFGLNSSGVLRQTTAELPSLNKPLGHDISRISLHQQTITKVNQSEDVEEQEAQTVAPQVMQEMNEPENHQTVQREELPEEEEERTGAEFQSQELEEELQTKPVDSSPQVVTEEQPNEPVTHDISRMSLRVQTKLTINQPGDIYEQQADTVARQVMQKISEPRNHQFIQHEASPETELQRKFLVGSATPVVQRQGGGVVSTSNLETSIQQARQNGQPLSKDIRQPMEEAFGADFNGVKIHTDSRSHELNQTIQARAFTTGQDIFFRQGEYNPGSYGGKELLAHELTHVVQQNGNAVQAKSLPHQAVKKNKIQAKALLTSTSIEQPIQRRENPQQQPEQDNQGQPEQATLKADVQTQEGQPQAPTDKDVAAASPPADGGGTTNPPPADGGGATNPPPADGGGASIAGGKAGQESALVQQAVPISAEDPSQILEQLKNIPPTQAAATYTQAQVASVKALENQKQQLQATIPEIPAPTGLPPQTSELKKAASVAQEQSQEQPGVIGGLPGQTAQTGDQKSEQQQPNPGLNGIKLRFGALSSVISSSESSSGTEGSDISTSAGERPKVDMTGEANPSQMNVEQGRSHQQVLAAKKQAARGIHQDFGENKIFPKPSNETLKANKQLSGASLSSNQSGEVPAVPGEIVGGLNQSLTPYYQAKIAPEQQKYLIGKQKFDADSNQAREDATQQVTNLNQKSAQKQLEQQKQAQEEVAKARQEWQAELDNAEKDYEEKAGQATKEQRQKIDEEKAKGEGKADEHLKEAEQKAEAEKKKAQEEEAKKKEEAEKESQKSGWDRFWGGVKSFFNSIIEGLKTVINAIFDALRAIIKTIFEAAKKLAMAAIDLARTVITGLIKAFGEILKGLVRIVFAAFPEISKKITDKIDQVVNKAVEIVNSVADFLQKAVAAVLDFLANTLDTLLGLVQSLYNGIFTVIGMIITGEFVELIKRLGNLVEAAKAMPPQFETAAYEELLGGNLDQPLSPEELAQAQQAGVKIPGLGGEDAPQMGEAGEMPSAPWTEDNVGVDAVEENMELSPELAAELMEQTNGEGEVMLGESADESRSMEAIISEATGEQQTQPEQEQQQYPDDGLTPKQRAEIKWELMKQGIKQWFSDNWPILLAALIAAAAVIIGLIIASGGAILAALPVIMQILTVVFAADAIARIGGHLRDYLTKGWEGDIQGGGKSLAKALAAGAIELIMLLTFGVGKVTGKGVKAVAKGTANVARKASRAVIRSARYTIQKGKVLFKGIAQTGIGKQFKKLEDLGRGLLDRMRFKAFRIRLANRWFRLEGLINPWVLIAQGRIQEVQEGTPGAVKVSDDNLKNLEDLPLEKQKELLEKLQQPNVGTKRKLEDTDGDITATDVDQVKRIKAENFDDLIKSQDKEAIEQHLEAIIKSGDSMNPAQRQQLIKLAEDFGNQVNSGKVSEAMEQRLKNALQQFEPQNIASNPVMAEVWQRTMKRLKSTKWGRYLDDDGMPKPEYLNNKDVMTSLYTQARSKVNDEMKRVMDEIKDAVGPIKNEVTSLPKNVELHHLLYKAKIPEFAVTPENIILALRKAKGKPDELHDLLHYISSGASLTTEGKNRWKTLLPKMEEIIKQVYNL
ncbi:MAG: DUF4157 domain-containing protein [Nostoc sp. DedQUE11]|nr:DUF4157 domain-containing protein [Nostoc sp. DedQUE11]